ncbi:MAG: hypothetical protein HY718_12480, partial [Planctomycetes bacterium]|nr:hypothetical protein [Planctomycetota bacterium]
MKLINTRSDLMTLVAASLIVATVGSARAQDGTSAASGAFDAAPFGFSERSAGGKAYGVRWAEPRKVRRLAVEFAADATVPPTESLKVQYWHRHWNGRPDPIATEVAAGGEGWAAMDDWTNGEWKTAETQVQADGKSLVFTFAPTSVKEIKEAGDQPVSYRKTIKLRLVSEQELPRPVRFQAFTDAVCQPLTVRILWGKPAEASIRTDSDDPCRLEVFNGSVVAVRPVKDGKILVDDRMGWTLPAGAEDGIEADLVMAVDSINARYDRTIVTVRSKNRPLSFAAAEAARGDRILVDDLGVLVVRGDDPATLDGYRQTLKEFPGRTIYDRVARAGEQTLDRAWGDMPIKHPLWFVHGLPGDRNAMRQDPNGDIGITNVRHWFARKNVRSAKDSDRKEWTEQMLWVRFGFPEDSRRGGRELKDGYLPLLKTWWQDGPLYYEQKTILDKLQPDLTDIRLDDPTVLLVKVRVVNASATDSAQARLRITTHDKEGEKLTLEGDRIIAMRELPRFRCLIRAGGRGELAQQGDAIGWSLTLAPGESHELFVAVPSVTLDKDEEINALAKRDFEADA